MSLISLICEKELREAQAAYRKVFASFDAYGTSFQPTIEHRAILEISGYAIDNWIWESLVRFSPIVSDEIVYFSMTDEFTGTTEFPYHYTVPLSEQNPYSASNKLGLFMISEHSIYPPSGTWGIITSDEFHAVVGGPLSLIEQLFKDSPKSEKEHQKAVMELWIYNRDKLGSDVSWMPSFLSHVYGEVEAKRLLTEYGLT